jgi:hypothetical protein
MNTGKKSERLRADLLSPKDRPVELGLKAKGK